MNSVYRICLLFLISAMLFSGCQLSYRIILGIKPLNWQSKTKIEKEAKRRGLQEAQTLVLNDSTYFQFIDSRAKSKFEALKNDGDMSSADSLVLNEVKSNWKNDLQPVQVRFFDSSGGPLFKMVNCFVDPPIPMDWNQQGCFDEFPPRPIEELKKDHNDSLSVIFSHVNTLQGKVVRMKDFPEADYYAIVFWNSFFHKPSKKLIKELRSYQKRFSDKNTHYIYVNNNNAQLWQRLTKEQKIDLEKFIASQSED